MSEKITFFLVLIIPQLQVLCQPNQTFRIINAQTSIQYLQTTAGSANTANRKVSLRIVYWSDKDTGNSDQTLNFVVASTNAPNAQPDIKMNAAIIEAKKFSTTHDTVSFDVPVTINSTASFSPEFFTIGLKVGTSILDPAKGGSFGVAIIKDPIQEATITTPVGFTYLNAVNFDFENSSGSSYVGHLNIFIPSIGRINRNKGRTDSGFLNSFGMNLGIMKINYSKGGDSINTSYNYAENTLINPLDSIKAGTHFYRHYNSLTTTSKNTSWSFYFQPTFNLIYRKDFKLLIHAHSEFFVNTWSTTTTLKNLLQVNDSITASTPDSVLNNLKQDNQFNKSLTDPVTLNTSDTKLSFYYGAGLTLFTNLWDGGSLFVQPTLGRVIAYLSPEGMITKTSEANNKNTKNGWFHLTRFELKQKLTTSLQAVAGVNVRGRFKDDPTYAAYIGINLGLDGLKGLFNK